MNNDIIIGERFGRLTILREVLNAKKYQKMVEVQCDCEDKTIFETALSGIKRGLTTSCGCFRKEQAYISTKKYNTYDLTGEYGIGYTFKNEPFYFDLEDYNKIKDICWRLSPYKYVLGNHKDGRINLHNLVMNSLWVDHIYHNKQDNRKENLRLITNQQNSFNKKALGHMAKFGIKGIRWYKRDKKWVSNIMKNGKNVYRKRFKNITDAIPDKIEAEKLHFGEYRYAWEQDIKWEELLEYEKELKNNI